MAVSYLSRSDLLWVEAITHEHAERVSHSPQHSYSLCVRHSQQAVVVHLQDPHAHLQTAISCCCTSWTHLFEYGQSMLLTKCDMIIIYSVNSKAVLDNLGDEDTFICGIKGVSCMTLCPTANTNAKFLPWLLLDYNFLKQHMHSLLVTLPLTLHNLLLLGVLPASQVVKGLSVPAYGSLAYWPKEHGQLLDVWRDAGRWNLLPEFGLRHAAHFDLQAHEESPEGEINGQSATWQD